MISDIKMSKERFVGSNKITDGCDRPVSRLRHPERDRLRRTSTSAIRIAPSPSCRPARRRPDKMVADRKVKFPEIGPLTRAHRQRHAQGRQRVRRRARAWPRVCSPTTWRPTCSWWAARTSPARCRSPAHSIEGAIKQGGVGVEMGLLAFKWGRMAVIDPDFVRAEIKKYEAVERGAAADRRGARDRRRASARRARPSACWRSACPTSSTTRTRRTRGATPTS